MVLVLGNQGGAKNLFINDLGRANKTLEIRLILCPSSHLDGIFDLRVERQPIDVLRCQNTSSMNGEIG